MHSNNVPERASEACEVRRSGESFKILKIPFEYMKGKNVCIGTWDCTFRAFECILRDVVIHAFFEACTDADWMISQYMQV